MNPKRRISHICALLAFWITPLAAIASEGSVLFGNGDRLSGSAQRIDENNNLIWNSEILLSEVPLKLENILEMSLLSKGQVHENAPHIATLSLTNGDSISGELKALDEQHVTLKTPFGGLLKLRRSMSSQLEISKSERTLYSGPFDLTQWVISEGAQDSWTLQNGSLISHNGANIARRLQLPPKARFSFTASWRSSLRLRLLLRSDDGESTQPDNCYDLAYNRRFVYLRKRWSDENDTGSKIIGQSANIQNLNEKETARFDFYLDQESGEIALYVDGAKAQVWTDEAPKEGAFGEWVHFITEEGYPVRISQIEMAEWASSNLPDDRPPTLFDETDEGEGQKIFLQNGDVLIGEVGLVKDDTLQVKTAHTPVNIPIVRISSVKLTDKDSADYEEPKREAGDVRAWLGSGGRITFKLRSFADGKIVGTSQTFGAATFNLEAFSRIEYNIYKDEFRPLRLKSDW